MRLIDADALIPKIKGIIEAESQIYRRASWGFAAKCLCEIEDAPTIEPERKKGKWIRERLVLSTGGSYPVTRCSECKNALPLEWDANFCPNCGADMREPEDIPMEYFESGGR